MKVLISSVLTCLTINVALAQTAPSVSMRFNQPYPSYFNNGGGLHEGLDFPVPVGTAVRAVADGEVINLGPNERNKSPFVTILHPDGLSTFYIHIDDIKVKIGDQVKQGDVIAKTALTGRAGPNTDRTTTFPHLHLELRQGRDFRAKLDPETLNMTCPKDGGKYHYPVGCQ